MSQLRKNIMLLAVPLFVLVAGIFPPPAVAEPGWIDVPQELKKQPGSSQKDGYHFATGMALAEPYGGRDDKAHELARKKSLVRAMQQIHLTLSCENLKAELSQQEFSQFVEIFFSQLPDLRVGGMVVVRQWREGRSHFTSLAVPVSSLREKACPFPNLMSAISQYLQEGQVSVEGLIFCLRHIPRYDSRADEVRRRLRDFYPPSGENVFAWLFHHDGNDSLPGCVYDSLAENRVFRADTFMQRAENSAAAGNWSKALSLTGQALDLMPNFSRAYLLMADYLLRIKKEPTLACISSKMALRAGMRFQEALGAQVAGLSALGSDETQVWQYLLDKAAPDGELPDEWVKEQELLRDAPITALVIGSCGQAVAGKSGWAAPEYHDAVDLFGQAMNDDDIMKTLALLISAAEKAPDSALTWNLIGACYRNLNRPFMALPFLWQAVELRSDYDMALTNLALCCQELGLEKSARYYFSHDAVKKSENSWVQESYYKYQEKKNDGKNKSS